VRFAGGGQAANTAAWLAAAAPPTDVPATGTPAVTLIAAVGADDAGRARIAELTRLGVRCAVRAHPGATTGSVVVLTSAGERTMVADRGANLLLAAEDVTAAIAAEPDPGHLHLSGYPLLDARTRPAGQAALTAARARGATTSVDTASAAPLARLGPAAFLDLVRGVDLLLTNADEAEVLAGPGPAERQAAALARIARNVVVKRGAAGAIWCDAAGVVAVVGGESVRQVDPTGAGDAFAAGLLAAWCTGADPRAALAAGAALGARAVARIGARPDRSDRF
jgi:sugar/nucleoside kinase (ribokinase family)